MGASNRSDAKVWYALRSVGGTFEGEPVFMTSIKKKPSPPPPNLEERGGNYFLTFTDIEGVISALNVREGETTYNGKKVKTKSLVLIMHDDNGSFNVDLGKVTGRYATNLMNRLIRPELKISEPISMRPYKFEKDGVKFIGVSVTQNGVKIEAHKKEELAALDCPEAVETDLGWDFSGQARWLFAQVRNKLEEDFLSSPPLPPEEDEDAMDGKEAMTKFYGEPEEKPKQTPSYEDDDLPFS